MKPFKSLTVDQMSDDGVMGQSVSSGGNEVSVFEWCKRFAGLDVEIKSQG